MSRLASIKIPIKLHYDYFYCGKWSLLSGSLWKMFFSSASADLSESLRNGNVSSISFHLARQPTSQHIHGCLLTAGFSVVPFLNVPTAKWQRTLYSMQLLLSVSQNRAIFLVFFLLAVSHCYSAKHLLVQWWVEHVLVFQAVLVSWELKHFPFAFRNVSISLYPT